MAFAVFHLLLFLGVLAWAVASFVQGNVVRGVLLLAFLAAYYVLALHRPVKNEIARRRKR